MIRRRIEPPAHQLGGSTFSTAENRPVDSRHENADNRDNMLLFGFETALLCYWIRDRRQYLDLTFRVNGAVAFGPRQQTHSM